MEEQYQKLKKVIQEANPEIMELKFGCEIICNKGKKNWQDKRKGGEGKVIQSFVGQSTSWSGYDKTDDNISAVMESGVIRPTFSVSKNEVEILGRPIRLADVLLAIGMDGWDGNKELEANCLGIVGAYWNLFDDNLDHQSDETKQFLIELLNNEPNN